MRLMVWCGRPAELTAKFIDAKLRSGGKGQSEEDLELILDQVLTIFRFIQVNLTFHKTSLSLLRGKMCLKLFIRMILRRDS